VQISADGCGSDADEADPGGSNSDSDFDSWQSSLRSQRSTQFETEAGERVDTVLIAEADGCSGGCLFREADYIPGDGSANPCSSDSDSGSDSDSDFDIGAEQLRECDAAYSYMQLQQAELDQLRQNADLSGSDLFVDSWESGDSCESGDSGLDSDEELDELNDCDQFHEEDGSDQQVSGDECGSSHGSDLSDVGSSGDSCESGDSGLDSEEGLFDEESLSDDEQ
jgi:hypothetical protein